MGVGTGRGVAVGLGGGVAVGVDTGLGFGKGLLAIGLSSVIFDVVFFIETFSDCVDDLLVLSELKHPIQRIIRLIVIKKIFFFCVNLNI